MPVTGWPLVISCHLCPSMQKNLNGFQYRCTQAVHMHIHMHVMHGRSPSSKSGWEVLLRPLLRKRPTLRAALLAEGDAAPYGAAAGPMAPMAPVGFPGASGMQGPWQPGERCLVWSNSAQRWCDLVNLPGRLCQTDFFWTKGSLRFCVFAG